MAPIPVKFEDAAKTYGNEIRCLAKIQFPDSYVAKKGLQGRTLMTLMLAELHLPVDETHIKCLQNKMFRLAPLLATPLSRQQFSQLCNQLALSIAEKTKLEAFLTSHEMTPREVGINDAPLPDRADGAAALPDRADGAAALPDRADGAAALPDRANGAAALPDRADGAAALPDRADGAAALPDRADGAAALPDRADGAAALPDRADGAAALPDHRADGAAALPDHRADGAAALPDRADGAAALPDRADGAAALPDRADGAAALPDRADGAADCPDRADGAAALPDRADGAAALPDRADGAAALPDRADGAAALRLPAVQLVQLDPHIVAAAHLGQRLDQQELEQRNTVNLANVVANRNQGRPRPRYFPEFDSPLTALYHIVNTRNEEGDNTIWEEEFQREIGQLTELQLRIFNREWMRHVRQ